ncbi:MAG: FAD-dependent oxidoreductase [Elusimicrobia bacterium]|nr:FAD-dependent oxidoreductase [Elusimicrobiota bacterium]
MIKTDVLILGGGLAGLSAAYHLNQGGRLGSLVLEKNPRPGGLAGSINHEGFVFDHTGHLLHLHDSYGEKLVMELLAGNVASHQRKSWIYLAGRYARYPFQANTYGLPDRVIEECVLGFLKTIHRPPKRGLGSDPSFKDWCLRQFGEGICRHFMFPYNEKLWRMPLAKLTTQWQGRFIPRPKTSEVLRGALMEQKELFGYNAAFRYPVRGGIQALPDALAARLEAGQFLAGHAVVSVDLRERVAVARGVGEISYKRLVNTVPLPQFLDLASPLPASVLEARRKLRWNTVYCLNLGVGRPDVSEKHWIYFPEKKYPFYRVGFYNNFSKLAAPKGASSLYIELSRKPGERIDLKRMENAILRGLRGSGLLKSSDKIIAKLWTPIPCAYVVYDFDRTRAVEAIFAHLKRMGADSIGRYGAWKYSFMEEAVLDGKRCAENLGLSA